MPDHHRTKASSNAFDSPLSLVVAHEDRLKEEEKNHGSSPGRSSGFSDGSGDENYHRQRLASEGDLPLSLVVRSLGEIESYDSGHEEDHHPHAHHRVILEEPDVTIAKVMVNAGSEKSGIKIKDFAKLLCEKSEDNALSSEVHSEYSSYEEVHPQAWNGSSGSLSGKESFPCEFCDKIFINKYHLQSHLVTHTGERSFECRKCHKTFGRKSTLRAHMTTHTKVSNFMCPICDKACNDNNSLEEHIRMHTGEKPFVCSICSKSYARKSHLNVHYRVHTGERPFVCLNCRKDFTEKRFLNDHIQTAHSGQDGPLKCPNCFREFAYKTSLKQHLKKQMCVKNLSRTGNLANNNGGNNNSNSNNNNNFINNGSPNISCGNPSSNLSNNNNNTGSSHPHSKQFSCPFCEKSYSWKQTLKQHVSMYHRNKVHTDEFWKYELTKHRRAVVDSKTNEDMWKKQLGKHGSEQKADNTASNEMWLEQINQSSNPSKSALSAEMKLLALQSLQSSLKLMKMQEEGGEQSSVNPQKDEQLPIASPVAEAAAVVPVPPPPPPLPVPADPPSSQQDAGYLSLLAHISSAQRRVAEKEEALRSDSPSLPEEPAAKRTQMWLAQLGRYRQKSVQYEIEKNHEELWEEQIAKIKQNPVKSPLEPVEITIDDDEEEVELNREEEDDEEGGYLHLGGVEEHEQEHHHHVPGLIMTEEANIKEERAAEEERIIMGEPHDPLQLQLQAYEDQRGVSPPPSSPHQLKHIVSLPNTHSPPSTCKMVPLMSALQVQATHQEDDPELISSDGSVLKSILLDRIGRKRPSLDPTPVPPKANHQEDSTDILRRRLLGLKEEPVLLVVDVESDNNNKSSNSSNSNIKNSSNKISNNLRDSNIKKDEQSSSPENNKSSPKKKEEEGKSSIIEQKEHAPRQSNSSSPKPQRKDSTFAHTSVLKHLLHRYTESHNME